MKKPLIIGQAPNSTDVHDGRPVFSGRSGQRLADLAGISLEEFHRLFDTVNVFDEHPGKSGKGDAFPIDEARIRIDQIDLSDRPGIVLAGRNVARAFGFDDAEYMCWFFRDSLCFVVIPHPSGVNRWYNNPDNIEQMSFFMQVLAQDTDRARAKPHRREHPPAGS